MYLYSILTVNFNGYEPLREPLHPNPNVEYVCVTDNKDLKSDVWKIVHQPDAWFLDIKHNPYEYISTDVCLWLDGSYQIIDDPTEEFVIPFIHSDKEMMISVHNLRHNVYEELIYWIFTRGLNSKNGSKMFEYLVAEDFSSDTLFQTSCILTKKTDEILSLFDLVRQLDKIVSVDGRYRDDQTIISYVIAKFYYRWDKMILMDFSHTSNNKFFKWCYHGLQKVIQIEQKSKRCFDEEQKLLYCLPK